MYTENQSSKTLKPQFLKKHGIFDRGSEKRLNRNSAVHCFVQFRCNIAHRYYTHLSYLAPLVQFKLKPYLEIVQDNQLIAYFSYLT